jgi:nicotinamide-nucleotide amidase
MLTFDAALVAQATDFLAACRKAGIKAATAESCTGGLVGGLLTEIPGSSDVVERGFIVYSNHAKIEMLGVDKELVRAQGAVNEPVVRAMAEGAIANSRAQIACGISGIAGPGSHSARPAGLVHMAAARTGKTTLHRQMNYGDIGRTEVRLATVRDVLALMRQLVD